MVVLRGGLFLMSEVTLKTEVLETGDNPKVLPLSTQRGALFEVWDAGQGVG